jgi:phosphate transport system ATP-binding protein
MGKAIEAIDLDIYYGSFLAVQGVNMHIRPKTVTALIGPSGCGKSTYLRAINRMHEVIPGARVEGRLELDGTDLYGPNVDPVGVRRQIGMVFQRPNPFPTMSIYDNVVAGQRVTHNMQQAARVSDYTGFFNIEGTGKPGKLVEMDETKTIFSKPTRKATEDYVSGRFG